MSIIQLSNVGKAYKQYPSRLARLAEWSLPFQGEKQRHILHWVLRDINFTIEQGESLGIIGINGAGKSTLLKLITGTSRPSTGSIQIAGKIAALLELGMGFHPDFTGRQNVFMAGQLIGLSIEDLNELLPEIEAFAEIGDYIDQPVRVYSSGMQMRLAFSLATARRPDVLIIDEALSVGDTYFQHKSFNRIRAFKKEGSTLLIVSHDKGAIQSICDRALLLDEGGIVKEGVPEEVMDYYNALLAQKDQNSIVQKINICNNDRVQTVSGTGEAKVTDIGFYDNCGQPIDTLTVGEPVTLKVKIQVLEKIKRLVLGYMIKDRLGQVIFGTNTHIKKIPLHNLESGDCVTYSFFFPMNLGEGNYSIATALVSTENHLSNNYEWRDLALVFDVLNRTGEDFIGCTWLDPVIKLEKR